MCVRLFCNAPQHAHEACRRSTGSIWSVIRGGRRTAALVPPQHYPSTPLAAALLRFQARDLRREEDRCPSASSALPQYSTYCRTTLLPGPQLRDPRAQRGAGDLRPHLVRWDGCTAHQYRLRTALGLR